MGKMVPGPNVFSRRDRDQKRLISLMSKRTTATGVRNRKVMRSVIFPVLSLNCIIGLKASLLGRLGLSEKKLKTLSIGLQQIAEKADVLGLFKSLKFSFLYLINYFRTNCSTNTFS